MIKKCVLTILAIFAINSTVLAVSLKDNLTGIENSIFGYDYSNDSEIKRVERIEEYLYGTKKSGAVKNRVEALENDSGIVVREIRQKNGNLNQELPSEEIINRISDIKEIPIVSDLKEDETVEYPIVDKMEQELFNKTFKNENIYNRIARLENMVFQKESKEDLNERVDKLAAVLHPKGRKMPMEEQTYSMQDFERLYNSSGLQKVDNQTIPFQLAALENEILKHEYIGDNNANRLARLEQKLFNRTFQNDADVQRLQRVLAASEAKKDSYKYENNRRMQNMATISQIGGILLMILAILL